MNQKMKEQKKTYFKSKPVTLELYCPGHGEGAYPLFSTRRWSGCRTKRFKFKTNINPEWVEFPVACDVTRVEPLDTPQLAAGRLIFQQNSLSYPPKTPKEI